MVALAEKADREVLQSQLLWQSSVLVLFRDKKSTVTGKLEWTPNEIKMK
jgi:hypothetical protein